MGEGPIILLLAHPFLWWWVFRLSLNLSSALIEDYKEHLFILVYSDPLMQSGLLQGVGFVTFIAGRLGRETLLSVAVRESMSIQNGRFPFIENPHSSFSAIRKYFSRPAII